MTTENGSEQSLRQCLADLKGTNVRMQQVFESKTDAWKMDLVKLRRLQSVQLFALSESLDRWSSQTLDNAARQVVTQLFNDMRRSISVTQTSWPLSLINDEESLAAYTAASRRTIEASAAFFSSMERLLGQS